MYEKKSWRFWIDRGGTFTDIIACDPHGSFLTRKVLSEPAGGKQQDAVVQGIRAILGLPETASIPAGMIDRIRMGTTVATNALLERKGEKVLLVTQRGFKDLLEIGHQSRPELFARAIRKVIPLYAEVLEVDGRVSVRGEVLHEPDLDAAESGLQAAYDRGFRSCALLLLHSHRFPQHEQELAALARSVGFTQVSRSSAVDPQQKIVSRGYTTVVDAYLSPVLHHYVEKLMQDLGVAPPFLFMQSHGGLADRAHFQGKDSLLSGPAGGLIGAQKIAQEAGHARFISFDMGGTSTDVALFDGQSFERLDETIVAGAPIRTALFGIHTVAAGGGSICRVIDGRLQVGPASAGARPGPACYRQGGPLTVTDCQLFLGRLQPDYFPAVFGANANEGLDRKASEAALLDCCESLQKQGFSAMSPEAMAQGFLRIADENMVQAIRQISVRRGQNPAEYALVCFGGAGGQHACRLAEHLGVREILVHPWAGVLSAYGIGVAPLRWMRITSIESPLDAKAIEGLKERWSALRESGREALSKQGAPDAAMEEHQRYHLRYEGSDTSLLIDAAPLPEMQRIFADKHKQKFGFSFSERALVIASIELEVMAFEDQMPPPQSVPMDDSPAPQPRRFLRVYRNNEWLDTPVYEADSISSGAFLQGPALITDPLSTLILEEGWQLERSMKGHLLLQKTKAQGTKAAPSQSIDPVLLEIFNRRFQAIAEQMGITLAQTAQSVNIKERFDFSCAVFDVEGQLVANAPHVPVHLGSMDASVQSIIKQYKSRLEDGDVFALNDPYQGGTHLPDITVVTPVFAGSSAQPAFFVAARGHHADVGGISPGSMPPQSQNIEEEGIWLQGFHLVKGGIFQEQALREVLLSGPYPSRNPAQNIADLHAQIAATRQGVVELRKLLDAYGRNLVEASMQAIQDNAAAAVQRLIRSWKPATFRADGDGGWHIQVRLEPDVAQGTATINFTGTSPQRFDNFNAPAAVVRAVVLYVMRILIDDDIPLNSGCLRPLNIVIPERSMLSPRFPAAVVAGNVETSQIIADALLGALDAMAASQGTMNNLTFGNERYQYYETIGGGAGAGPGFAGASAVQTHMTNSRITDPEVLESRFPVRLEEFSIRRGSGGAGAFSGGDGIVRRLCFLETMQVGLLSNRRSTAPFGLHGGQAGKPGTQWIERHNGSVSELGATDAQTVDPGDVLVIETPGGGGYGSAARR